MTTLYCCYKLDNSKAIDLQNDYDKFWELIDTLPNNDRYDTDCSWDGIMFMISAASVVDLDTKYRSDLYGQPNTPENIGLKLFCLGKNIFDETEEIRYIEPKYVSEISDALNFVDPNNEPYKTNIYHGDTSGLYKFGDNNDLKFSEEDRQYIFPYFYSLKDFFQDAFNENKAVISCWR